ncbi:MAG: DUF4238 domain-containing protein [Sphingopyxis sp.]|uniref:DUF4238 domain-containing protein n=1 Tax=Sphingopyxis sp. TaxID=1908224 RepID=UPI003D80F4EC
MEARPNEPKRHHFVPETYLEGFCDGGGYLWVGRKDDPQNSLRLRPKNVALRGYYYSQIRDDGTRDNRIEGYLSRIEGDWFNLRAKMTDWKKLTPEDCGKLWNYLAMQRVRVPAARDAAEALLAHKGMLEFYKLDEAGELAPYPEGVPDIVQMTRMSINPQASIEAMGEMLRGFKALIGRIGFQIIHNETKQIFLTSDNPVAIFDPNIPIKKMKPYVLSRRGGEIELVFPVDSKTLLWGHSKFHSWHAAKGPRHIRLKDITQIRRFNRIAAKFAYEIVVARDGSHSQLLRTYADASPVLGNVIGWTGGEPPEDMPTMMFGPRLKKPKWKAS